MRVAAKYAVCVLVSFAMLSVAFAATAVRPGGSAHNAAWTVMVYLDADNNLDPWGYVDVAEMEAVGSTASVNVVVLWDKYTAPAYLYRVSQGRSEVASGFALNGQEINMGSGETLKAFVDFSTKTYPASRYALILWDHGDDFRGFAWDDHPSEDATEDDFMTHDEIADALEGARFDILAFDGCVMSNLEVTYEYAARGLSIEYLVASEIYIPNQGFAYDGLLRALAASPEMGAYDFARAIVDSYMEYYSGGGWQVGLSVVRMSAVASFVSSISDLVEPLAADISAYRDCIGTARGSAMLSWSMYGWEAFVDFPTWASGLHACLGPDAAVSSLLDDVGARLTAALPYVQNTHALDVKGAGGIGVFFPGSRASFENNLWWRGDWYLEMQFPYTGWIDLLDAYWGKAKR